MDKEGIADAPLRVLSIVSVTTSMHIVRFLSAHLSDVVSHFDTVMYSVVVVQVSFLMMEREHALVTLSRRLSILMIIERIRMFALIGDLFIGIPSLVRIQGILINSLLVMTATIITPDRFPLHWREEVGLISTSIVYMYSGMVDFLAVVWPEGHLTLLFTALAVLVACLCVLHKGEDTVFMRVVPPACVSLINTVLVGTWRGALDSRLLYMAVVTTVAYGGAFLIRHDPTRDYLMFLVASGVSSILHTWSDVVVLMIVVSAMRIWPGPRSWATQCTLLVLVSVAVERILRYIEFLAVHDTFVTLKTSALVLQFVMHELGRALILF